MATKKASANAAQGCSDWRKLVEHTLKNVSQWAGAEQWVVVKHEKEISEQATGCYVVPVLTIELPSGRLHVEPIARYVAGADGRIDLLAYPVLNRVSLLRRSGKWVVRTDSGVDYPAEWNRSTFVKIAKELVRPT